MSQCLAAEQDVRSSCLPRVEQLRCYNQSSVQSGDAARLVCAARDGVETAAAMHTALVTVTALLVPATVALSLAIALTVIVNRKLHTVINTLAALLCANNIAWTAFAVVTAIRVHLLSPTMCSFRAFLFIVTRGIGFTTVVLITLLRYLMVVWNRTFPADRKHVATFVSAAVAPSLVKWLVRRNHPESLCRCIEACTPDGFAIVAKVKSLVDWRTIAMTMTEYGVGVLMLTFCYVRILIHSKSSRRRLKRSALPRTNMTNNPPSNAAHVTETENNQMKSEASGFKIMKRLRGRQSPEGSRASEPGSSLPKAVKHAVLVVTFLAMQERRNEEERRDSATVSIHKTGSCTDDEPAVHQKTTTPARSSTPELSDDVEEEIEAAVASAKLPSYIPPSFPSDAHCSRSAPPVSTETPAAGAATPECAPSPISARQTPSDTRHPPRPDRGQSGGGDGAILEPLELAVRTTAGGTGTSTSAARIALGPRPSRAHGSIEVIATVSLTAFIVILFATEFPYVLVGSILTLASECVVLAETRILFFLVATLCTGAGAILSPLVLVAFSGEFREAFWLTGRRLVRRLTGNTTEGAGI